MMSNFFSITRLLFASQIIFLATADVTKLWAFYDSEQETVSITDVAPDEYVAVASLAQTINQTGWAKLDLTTTAGPGGKKFTNEQQAYAAGFLEAHITRSLMQMHWTNTIGDFCKAPMTTKCKALKKFLTTNLNWTLQKAKDGAAQSAYWHQVLLHMHQIAGLQDGFTKSSGAPNLDIDVFGVYLFQVGGDMEDLSGLFTDSAMHSSRVSDTDFGLGTGHCSALIRLLKDKSDLYVSQDTWAELNGMLRILKKYSLDFSQQPLSSEPIPGKVMTFSSYPGVLMSGDDFYTISSGLVTLETTIGNSNPHLNKYIVPESLLEGLRTMVTNRLAISGQEWSQIFGLFNSGTYNNQWMIIDYKRFKPGSPEPAPGTFYVLEQIPHYVHFDDLTHLLYNQSYFGSYNTPYFPNIFNLSGMPALVAKYGDWFTYDKTPRALIFKRDVGGVTDLDSMTKLMRYNNFKEDPLSRCNCTPPYSAENAIACRDDLNPINGTYPFSALGHRPHIATDMKLTSYDLSKTLSFLAISSPPYDDLPAFQWSKSDYDKKMSHVGHPDIWKFPRILFNGSAPMA